MKRLLLILMGFFLFFTSFADLMALDIKQYEGKSPSLHMYSEFRFDSEGKFYIHVNIIETPCAVPNVKSGIVTKYVHVGGTEQYSASNSGNQREIRIFGEFGPRTKYDLYIDGSICGKSGFYYSQIETGGYSSGLEFISKGLYFSRINPVLRYRHREKSDVEWKIYRIEERYRHLFTKTEDILFGEMSNSSSQDITKKDVRAFRFLQDYPGTPKTLKQKFESSSDWTVGEIDLREYANSGDWLIIISEENHINKLVQFTNVGVQYQITGYDFLLQAVRLDTGMAIPAKIEFKDQYGKTIEEYKTDERGFFKMYSDAIPEMATQFDVSHQGDRITVPVREERISLESFPVSGESDGETRKAFVYSDRGLYRLGETVHLTAIVKDFSSENQKERDVEFMLFGPSGKLENVEMSRENAEDGTYTWDWQVPQDGKTGEYQLQVREYGSVIGTGTFSVEQIIPPTLEGNVLMLHPAGDYDNSTDTLTKSNAEMIAKFLFGAPASEKRWEYSCSLQRGVYESPNHRGYYFHDHFKTYPEFTFHQQKDIYLDQDGKGTVNCNQTDAIGQDRVSMLPGPGKLKILANIYEEGGRYIEVNRTSPVWFHEAYPGIRPMFSGKLEVGEEAVFKLVAVDPRTGEAKPGVKLKVEILEKDYWGWFYFHKRNEPIVDSEITRIKKASSVITTGEEPTEYRFTPQGEGEWEILVTLEGSEVSSRFTFRNKHWDEDAGFGNVVSQQLIFTPDKKRYLTGDTANVLITAPFDGTLHIAEELSGREVKRSIIKVENRQATYSFTVTKKHSPWMYLTGTLLRTADPNAQNGSNKSKTEKKKLNALEKKLIKAIKTDEAGNQKKTEEETTTVEVEMPYRAIGLLPIEVQDNDEVLKFRVISPKRGKPETDMVLDIQATNGNGEALSEEVYMTVAVVDEGILQLGKYKTPDPYPVFHKRKAYTTEWYDTFGKVVPYSLHRGRSIYGSDQSVQGVVPEKVDRVIPMAYWSGIVKTDENGHLKLTVPIKDYSGKVRVMIVGWKNRMLGNFDRKIPVFSPIDLQTSLPRVFGVFDRSRAVVDVFNNTEKTQSVSVAIDVDGAVNILNKPTITLTIPPKRSKVHHWDLAGEGVTGKAKFTFTANTTTERRTRTTELLLRPVSPDVVVSFPFAINSDESKAITMPDSMDIIPGSGKWQINISGSPAVKVAKHLKNLISYPHGCAEQTTSRLFAMTLMQPTLGQALMSEYMGEKAAKADSFIKAGIDKLSKMQMSNGGFAYWMGGSYQYEWLNAYVTHYLWKAKQLKHEVPDSVIERALDRLKDQYRYSNSADVVAYSAFVLALFEEIPASDLEKVVRFYISSEMEEELGINSDNALQKMMKKFFKSAKKEMTGDKNRRNRKDKKEYRQLSSQERIALPLVKATLRLVGEEKKADALFNLFKEPSLEDPQKSYWLSHKFLYRDAAIGLSLYGNGIKKIAHSEEVIEYLDYLSKRNYLSTHTATWALLATNEIFQSAEYTALTVQTPDNKIHNLSTKPGSNLLQGKFLLGKEQTIRVRGSEDGPSSRFFGTLTFSGSPKSAPTEGYSDKLSVRRIYFSEFGEVLTPPFKANQGERVHVAVLSKLMTDDFKTLDNVAIEDWLPAGFELENPKLVSNIDRSFFPGEVATISEFTPDHVDYLDDRIAIFGAMDKEEKVFFYTMRAITQGDYQVLPIKADSMYLPKIKAMAVQNGRVQILPAGSFEREKDVPNVVQRLAGPAEELNRQVVGIGISQFGSRFCEKTKSPYLSGSTLTNYMMKTNQELIGWGSSLNPFKEALLNVAKNGVVMKSFYYFHKQRLLGNIKLNCSASQIIELLDEVIPVLSGDGLSPEKRAILQGYCQNRDRFYGQDHNIVYSKVTKNECDYHYWFQKYAQQGVSLGALAEIAKDFQESLVELQEDQTPAVKKFLIGFVLNENFGGPSAIAQMVCQRMANFNGTLTAALLQNNTLSNKEIFKYLLAGNEVKTMYQEKREGILRAIKQQCSTQSISSQFLVKKLNEMVPLIKARHLEPKKELLLKNHCRRPTYEYQFNSKNIQGISYDECSYYQWFRKYRMNGYNMNTIEFIADDIRKELMANGFEAE